MPVARFISPRQERALWRDVSSLMVDTHGACTVHNVTVPPPLSTLFADSSLAEADFDSFRSLCATDDLDYQQRLARQLTIAPPKGRRLVGVGAYSQPLECLKPKDSWKLRHEPLRQKLVPGRVCAHALCATDNCALHVRDEVERYVKNTPGGA